jgi:hypothetical protein
MAGIEAYRDLIQAILEEYAQYKPSYGEVEMQVIADRERDHYQLVGVGWNGAKRVYGCIVHVDIKNGKFWIQHDGTEIGIARELESKGVPAEHIVLGFQPPYKRPYTNFAVE